MSRLLWVDSHLRRPIRRAWRRATIRRGRDVTEEMSTRDCLVLAPHPDDETLGCGAAILRKRLAGTQVTVAIATDGRHSHSGVALTPRELADLRAAEAAKACNRLGVSAGSLINLGFEDGALGTHEAALTTELVKLIDRLRPDEVLVTSALDPHPDHQALNRSLRAALPACQHHPKVADYPIWYWAQGPWQGGPGGLISKCWHLIADPLRSLHDMRVETVRVDGVLLGKLRALAAYRSQMEPLYDDQDWPVLDANFVCAFLESHEVFIPWAAQP